MDYLRKAWIRIVQSVDERQFMDGYWKESEIENARALTASFTVSSSEHPHSAVLKMVTVWADDPS